MHVSDTLLFKRVEDMAEVSLVDITMLYNDTLKAQHITHIYLYRQVFIFMYTKENI